MAEKIYESQVGLPERVPGRVNIGAFASVAEEGARVHRELWGEVGRMGETLGGIGLDINKRLLANRQMDEFTKASMSLREGMYADREALQGTDPATWPQTFRKKTDERFQGLIGGIQDPVVKRHLMLEYSHLSPTFFGSILHEARQQMIEDSRATAADLAERSLTQFQQARSPQEQAQVQAGLFSYLDAKAQAGVLHPDAVQKAKEHFLFETSKGMALKDIERDPAGAFNRLNQSDFRQSYPGLRPEDAATLRNHAYSLEKRNQTEAYQHLASQILLASNPENPQGVLPTREQIDAMAPQLGPEHYARAVTMLAAAHNQGKIKNDQESEFQIYYELQHGNLTLDKLDTNIRSGHWTITPERYNQVANEIAQKQTKGPKEEDTAYYGTIEKWEKMFSWLSPHSKEFSDGLNQVVDRKKQGTLGTTPEEIKKNIDEIMNTQHDALVTRQQPAVKPAAQQKAWYNPARWFPASGDKYPYTGSKTITPTAFPGAPAVAPGPGPVPTKPAALQPAELPPVVPASRRGKQIAAERRLEQEGPLPPSRRKWNRSHSPFEANP